MIPLMSGTKRAFSSEDNDFWCCVGSGMESHAKHGESIYWHDANHLIVNLFISSTLDWREQNAKFELATDYPRREEIRFSLTEINKPKEFSVSLRIPAWCENATLKINGKRAKIENRSGYATVKRKWKKGDSILLNLPMKLRFEPTPDDPNVIAFLNGPLVLAADLGASEKPYQGLAPVLVGADLVAAFAPSADGQTFKTRNIGRPQDYEFKPFYSQWENRTAVYFRRFTDAQWKAEEIAFAAEQARLKDLEARTIDVMYLGEMQPERDHQFESKNSYPVSYRGRNGRDARSGGFFEFTMKVRDDAPLVLRVAYWGEERRRTFYILIDGKRLAAETLNAEKPGEFIERDYPIPQELIKGKTSVVVRFEPETGNTAGPVFGCRIYVEKK